MSVPTLLRSTFSTIFFLLVTTSAIADPIVETDLGQIRGLRADNGDYDMYLGIPYAAVEADKPFGAATPYPAFQVPYNAYNDTIVCPQISQQTPVGQIDCLRLNVFVPNSTDSQNQLPVIVWIHGGRFEFGSGARTAAGPEYLITHDVIIVTINYRLGPYGFLCVDVPEVSSNSALKDQRLAFRWVKQNIEKFGGNPNSITIMGQSAGSMSIDYHLHYSADEGLFHKAIMQSGTAQVYAGTFQENGSRFPILYAKELGLDTDDPREAIIHLSRYDPISVMEAFAKHPSPRPEMIPCDETEFENSDKFVNEKFTEIVPNIQNIPILIGFTNEECLVRYALLPAEDYSTLTIVQDLLESIWNFNETELELNSKRISQFYWGDQELSINIKQQLTDFESDMMYAYTVTRDIKKYYSHDAKIYHYVFSYSGTRNMVKAREGITEGGAVHSDDIGYFFGGNNLPEPTTEDQIVIDRVTTMFTNFAKYGDPTPETSSLLPVKWEPITDNKFNYLNINSELSLGQRPNHDRFAFLDLFFKLNQEKHKTYVLVETTNSSMLISSSVKNVLVFICIYLFLMY